AAAAQGARDPELTREEVRRAHRALAVAVPLVVAVGMVWADPVVRALLPKFADGVPALRLLAIGALLLSGATLPGYYVLAGAGGLQRRSRLRRRGAASLAGGRAGLSARGVVVRSRRRVAAAGARVALRPSRAGLEEAFPRAPPQVHPRFGRLRLQPVPRALP